MNHLARVALFACCVASFWREAFAQAALPPVREISVRVAESSEAGGLAPTVVLSDGRIVRMEWSKRRLVRMDPGLVESTVLFDRETPAPLTFPATPPVLFVGQGDTVYMTDLGARGVRVISPTGSVVRRQGFADNEDLVRITNRMAGAQFGAAGEVYFGATLVRRQPQNFSAEPRDSLYLVRSNSVTRRTDTLGYLDLKRSSVQIAGDSTPGEPRPVTIYLAPFESGDAIALTPRGELAVIRGNDFHVDWLQPDGRWRRSPPIPWPWKRYSAAEKQAIVAARDSAIVSGQAQAISPAGAPPQRNMLRAGPVPDVEPAFAPMSAIVDPDGLVWLLLGARSAPVVSTSLTYGAIDPSGQMVDRIVLPPGRRLLGFDRSGHIYVATLSGSLEAYRK